MDVARWDLVPLVAKFGGSVNLVRVRSAWGKMICVQNTWTNLITTARMVELSCPWLLQGRASKAMNVGVPSRTSASADIPVGFSAV